jgi:hypothetical protein
MAVEISGPTPGTLINCRHLASDRLRISISPVTDSIRSSKGQANGQDPEAFRVANEAAVGRKRDALRQAMLDRILHGTLGERPRVDALEKRL